MSSIRFLISKGKEPALGWLADSFGLRIHPPSALRRTYLDSFDRGLARKKSPGILVRERVGAQQTYRLTRPKGHVEINLGKSPRFCKDFPQGPIRRQLEESIGIRALLPLLSIEGRQQRIDVLNADRKVVARLYQEERRASASRRMAEPLPNQLRLESLRGYKKAFRQISALLESQPDLTKAEKGELEEAGSALGISERYYSSAISLELQPRERGDSAMKRLYLGLLVTAEANLEGVKRDWDSEFLHDFRVSVRRTRAALAQVKGVFPSRLASRYRKDFAWLGSVTGPCRDLDVYLLKMDSYATALPESVSEDLPPLVLFLEESKRAAHQAMVRHLESRRFHNLIAAWKRFLHQPVPSRPTAPRAQSPIGSVAIDRLSKVFRRVVKRGSRIDDSSPAEDLHRLRLDCKKLRYLLEFFRSLLDKKEAKRVIGRLKGLQDNLGDFNDLQVQQLQLREWAHESGEKNLLPPSTLLAIGRLLDLLEQQEIEERERFSRVFEGFAHPDNLERFGRMIETKWSPE